MVDTDTAMANSGVETSGVQNIQCVAQPKGALFRGRFPAFFSMATWNHMEPNAGSSIKTRNAAPKVRLITVERPGQSSCNHQERTLGFVVVGSIVHSCSFDCSDSCPSNQTRSSSPQGAVALHLPMVRRCHAPVL